jgi:hypothetical protein
MTEIQSDRLQPTCLAPTGSSSTILIALLAAAVDIGASLMLRYLDLGTISRIAVALLPVPANLGLIVKIVRSVRGLDDFQKRVHLEAVVIAFLATALAVLTYGFLEKADAVGPMNMVVVAGFMGIFYALGYHIAARHYR